MENQSPKDDMRSVHLDLLLHGQKTVAKEVTVEMFEEQAKLDERMGQAASDVIGLANQIAADGDPHKRQVAELLKDGVIRSLKAIQQGGTGSVTAGEGQVAAQAAPFLPASSSSNTSLPASSSPKALEDQSPPKAKRGRPPKPRPS